MLALEEFDCALRLYGGRRDRFYATAGDTTPIHEGEWPFSMKDIPPDTIAEAMFEKVCQGKTGK